MQKLSFFNANFQKSFQEVVHYRILVSQFFFFFYGGRLEGKI